jgi:hypothetical protein
MPVNQMSGSHWNSLLAGYHLTKLYNLIDPKYIIYTLPVCLQSDYSLLGLLLLIDSVGKPLTNNSRLILNDTSLERK